MCVPCFTTIVDDLRERLERFSADVVHRADGDYDRDSRDGVRDDLVLLRLATCAHVNQHTDER